MSRPVVLIVALAALLASACAAPGTAQIGTPVARATPGDLSAQFAYDGSAPLAVRETGRSLSGAVTVTEVEYANGRGAIAKATLVVPPGEGRRPGLVMVAGSNQARREMRDEAVGHATTLGIVAMVVDQSQVAAGRAPVWTFTSQDREEAVETVVDIRRAVDLLAARPDVDAERIGGYGFSYGAWLLAIGCAVDPRISLLVLRSGGPQILRELAGPSRAAAPAFASYLEVMSSVDHVRYARSIRAGVPVLVQNGGADATFTPEAVRVWHEAIGGAKVMRTYSGAGHALDTRASDDAREFLRERWQLR